MMPVNQTLTIADAVTKSKNVVKVWCEEKTLQYYQKYGEVKNMGIGSKTQLTVISETDIGDIDFYAYLGEFEGDFDYNALKPSGKLYKICEKSTFNLPGGKIHHYEYTAI